MYRHRTVHSVQALQVGCVQCRGRGWLNRATLPPCRSESPAIWTGCAIRLLLVAESIGGREMDHELGVSLIYDLGPKNGC